MDCGGGVPWGHGAGHGWGLLRVDGGGNGEGHGVNSGDGPLTWVLGHSDGPLRNHFIVLGIRDTMKC